MLNNCFPTLRSIVGGFTTCMDKENFCHRGDWAGNKSLKQTGLILCWNFCLIMKLWSFSHPHNLSSLPNFSYSHLRVYPNLDQRHFWDDTGGVNFPIGELGFDIPLFLCRTDRAIRCLHFLGLLFLGSEKFGFCRVVQGPICVAISWSQKILYVIQPYREFTSRTF